MGKMISEAMRKLLAVEKELKKKVENAKKEKEECIRSAKKDALQYIQETEIKNEEEYKNHDRALTKELKKIEEDYEKRYLKDIEKLNSSIKNREELIKIVEIISLE